MRRPGWSLAPVLTALLACGAIAGCGSSKPPGTGVDPAQAVPASAPLFAGAIVHPTAALRANARAAARALGHQADPNLQLLGLLQTPGSPSLSFKRDVAPWLGIQAGIFLSSPGAAAQADAGSLISLLQGILSGAANVSFPFAGSGALSAAQGAIVLDSTNATEARSFLNAQAARAGAHPASYRGVAYRVSAAGLAFGLVGHFAVIGNEAALQRTIDTNAGGPSLARAPEYARLHALAPPRALAHVYLNGAAAGAAGSRASAGLFSLLGRARTINVSLRPLAGSIALDIDTLRSSTAPSAGGALSGQGEAARALSELPSDAFVALGFGSAEGLTRSVQGLRSLFSLGPARGRPSAEAQSPGLSVKGLFGGLLAPVEAMTEASAQARRDFQSWMGPGAVFASGSGLIDLKAGLVIWSKNPALSRAAVAKLASRLRSSGASVRPASIPGTDAAVTANLTGLPVALEIADGRDAKGQTKFVIGIGEASIVAAVSPSGTLSAAPLYGAASSLVGEDIQPSLIVQVPTLLTLLEGAGLSEDPAISAAVPYLRALGTVAGGARSIGADAERFRVVLALRGG